MPKHSYSGLTALINQVITVDYARINVELTAFLDKLPNLPKAPASGALRYHHAYDGGLVDHIIDVFTIARDLSATKTQGSVVPALSLVDILLVAILHDIHKVQDAAGNVCYVPNILKSGKRSEAEPFEKSASYLHGEFTTPVPSVAEREFLYQATVDNIPGGIKSLALIKALAPALFDLLGDDVKFAIRYHDGCYAHNKFDLNGKETPLMILMHAADMLSSRLNRLK